MKNFILILNIITAINVTVLFVFELSKIKKRYWKVQIYSVDRHKSKIKYFKNFNKAFTFFAKFCHQLGLKLSPFSTVICGNLKDGDKLYEIKGDKNTHYVIAENEDVAIEVGKIYFPTENINTAVYWDTIKKSQTEFEHLRAGNIKKNNCMIILFK